MWSCADHVLITDLKVYNVVIEDSLHKRKPHPKQLIFCVYHQIHLQHLRISRPTRITMYSANFISL